MAIRNRDNLISSTSANIYVQSGNIKAIISSGTQLSTRVEQIINLDASSSYDKDQPLSITGTAAGISYSWTCHVESDYTADCNILLVLPLDYS